MVIISWGPGRLYRPYGLNSSTDRIFQFAISFTIVEVYLDSVFALPYPLHGCWQRITYHYNIQFRVASAFEYVFSPILLSWLTHLLPYKKRILRTIATTIEVLLTFVRFTMTYKTQRAFGDGIYSRISHMKTSTRLLYVFYRDGTLLFIPWVEN